MKCPGCQQDSSATAKFCEHCGAPLSRRCANCGTTLSASARFCPECGRPAVADRFHSPESYTPKHLAARILTSKTALEGERKQVTVLFAGRSSTRWRSPPPRSNTGVRWRWPSSLGRARSSPTAIAVSASSTAGRTTPRRPPDIRRSRGRCTASWACAGG
jgi:hypothetical protein